MKKCIINFRGDFFLKVGYKKGYTYQNGGGGIQW